MSSVDFLLDPTTGDLPLFNSLSSGPDVILQRLAIRLRTFLGEWLLDTSKGMPWETWCSTKGIPPAAMSARVRQETEGCPGVIGIQSWEYVMGSNGTAVTITGEVFIEGVDQAVPVVVPLQPSGGNVNPNIILPRGIFVR